MGFSVALVVGMVASGSNTNDYFLRRSGDCGTPITTDEECVTAGRVLFHEDMNVAKNTRGGRCVFRDGGLHLATAGDDNAMSVCAGDSSFGDITKSEAFNVFPGNNHKFHLRRKGTCDFPILSPVECTQAALTWVGTKGFIGSQINATVIDPGESSVPRGCVLAGGRLHVHTTGFGDCTDDHWCFCAHTVSSPGKRISLMTKNVTVNVNIRSKVDHRLRPSIASRITRRRLFGRRIRCPSGFGIISVDIQTRNRIKTFCSDITTSL